MNICLVMTTIYLSKMRQAVISLYYEPYCVELAVACNPGTNFRQQNSIGHRHILSQTGHRGTDGQTDETIILRVKSTRTLNTDVRVLLSLARV